MGMGSRALDRYAAHKILHPQFEIAMIAAEHRIDSE
jgi:hypothetical protein